MLKVIVQGLNGVLQNVNSTASIAVVPAVSQEVRQMVLDLNPIDDLLFAKIAQDKDAIREVVQIITGRQGTPRHKGTRLVSGSPPQADADMAGLL